MMLRHTLTRALELVLQRVASGDPDLVTAVRFVARSRTLYSSGNGALVAKVQAELDKLLDAARYDATPGLLANPFPRGPSQGEVLLSRAWEDARRRAESSMAPPPAGLGLTGWEDVGGLSRLEALGLVVLALQRLRATPEFGHGPLLPGLQR